VRKYRTLFAAHMYASRSHEWTLTLVLSVEMASCFYFNNITEFILTFIKVATSMVPRRKAGFVAL
jgi:hypothetical protein